MKMKFSVIVKIMSCILSFLMILHTVPANIVAEFIDGSADEPISVVDKDAKGDYSIVDTGVEESTESIVTTMVHDALYEDLERRDESVKHFVMSDGSYTAVEYSIPVHYLDDAGEWQDIDNSLHESGNEFSTKNAKIKFAKNINGNETLFTLHDENRKITMSLDGALKGTVAEVRNNVTEHDDSATQLQKMMTLDGLTSNILYRDILDGVDLEYVLDSLNIKENIIVKEKSENYNYSFTMSLNNLFAILGDDGIVRVYDMSDDALVYTMPEPIVYDANGTYASPKQAYFTLSMSKNGKYTLSVNVDEGWMNSDDRAYPVTVDPGINGATSGNATDTYIDSDNPAGMYYNFSFLAVGKGASGQEFISYYKLNSLPILPSSAYVTSASIELYINSYRTHGAYIPVTEQKIGAYLVNSDWANGASWNSVENTVNGKGARDILVNYRDIKYGESGYASWDITPIYTKWEYEQIENYGVAFKKIESVSANSDILFASSESSTNKPRVVVNYRDMKGIESYWSMSSHSVGIAGSGAVNNATGNLVFSVDTLTTTDSLMPFTLSFTYNTEIAGLDYEYPNAEMPYHGALAAKGFKMNIQETIVKKSYSKQDGTTAYYYVWADGDGTEHGFYAVEDSTTEYRDEDGLQLTMTLENNGTITIKDSSHTSRLFYSMSVPSNSNYIGGWYLRTITDKNGNELSFSHDGTPKPTAVIMTPNGAENGYTQLKILYDTNVSPCVIWNPTSKQAIILKYSPTPLGAISSTGSAYLRQIVYAHGSSSVTDANWMAYYNNGTTTNITVDATASYTYNSSGALSLVRDQLSGRAVSYRYLTSTDGRELNPIKSIVEYGGNTAGQSLEYSYGIEYTEIRTSGTDDVLNNSDDIITHYTFDTHGRAVSMYSMDVSRSTIYGASSGEYVSDNENANNSLKSSSVSGGNPVNYLVNGGFENSEEAWTTYGNLCFAYDNIEEDTVRSLGVNIYAQAGETYSLKQNVILPKGTYTLSLDCRTYNCEGVTVKLMAKSLADSTRIFIEDVPINELYSSYYLTPALTFEACSGEETSENFEISVEVVGGTDVSDDASIILDNVMLEKGIGASGFNYVQFSGLDNCYATSTNGASNISRSEYWKKEIAPDEAIDFASAGEVFGSSICIQGDVTSNSTSAYQIIPMCGLPETSTYFDVDGKSYMLSAFAKGSGQVTNEDSRFRIRVKVIYNDYTNEEHLFDFNPQVTDWQYVSGGFTTKDGAYVKEIEIYCDYKYHPGVAYFDNICLVDVKDSSYAEYAYDENGKMTLMETPSYWEYYEYDENGNMTVKADSYNDYYAYEYNENNILISEYYYTYSLNSDDGKIEREFNNQTVYLKGEIGTEYTYNETFGVLTSTKTFALKYNGSEYIEDIFVDSIVSSAAYNIETTTPGAIFGSMKEQTDENGNTVRYTYSSTTGLLMQEKYADNTGLHYMYDSMNRMTGVLPLINGSFTTSAEYLIYAYNSTGQVGDIRTYSTDYHFTYDEFGNVLTITAGTNTLATYSYNSNNGKLSSVTYGNGLVVEYVYDTLDRVKELCYNDDGTTYKYVYTYTSDGKLHTVENTKTNRGYMYRYDGKGQMIGYAEYDTSDDTTAVNIRYKYDDKDRLSTKNVEFAYSLGGGAATWEDIDTEYTYNSNDTLASLQIYSLDGEEYDANIIDISYEYDHLYRLTNKEISSYTGYDGPSTFEYAQSYVYYSDKVSQIWYSANTVNGNYTHSRYYTYDSKGNITAVRKLEDEGYVNVISYVYDDQNQLIRENNSETGKTYTYTYDNAGNRTSVKTYAYTEGDVSGLTPISTQGYIYSTTSGTSWGDRLSSINGTSITYDEIGNPLLYKGTTMTWSGRELLSMYNANERLTATFEYNDEGLRTRKVANGSNHIYTYDGSKIINEQIGSSVVVYLYDESGSPIGLRYRTSTMSESEFVSVFFEKNLFGDIIALYNINGVLIGSYTYDAWGNHTYTESGNTSLTSDEIRAGRYYNPFRYRGYYYDSETGLYYVSSRYYDPEIGRWINADGELSDVGGDILGYNLFAYCFNNPVNMDDPTGNWPKWLSGALNVVGGALQVAAGAALGATVGWTGFGAVAAGFLIVNGTATAAQGVGQIVNHVTNSNVMREDNIVRTGVQEVGRAIGGDTGAKIAGGAYDVAVVAANLYAGKVGLQQAGKLPIKVNINNVVNNPLDEFVTNGPADGVIQQYCRTIPQSGYGKIYATQLGNGLYQIANGHHRVAALRALGYETIKIFLTK